MKTKRIISVILVLAMVITMLPAVVFADTNTLEIVGSAAFISAPSGRYSKMPYKVMYNDVDIAKTADVKVIKSDGSGDEAEDVWFIDGELVVKGGASGTYALQYEQGGVKASKDVEVIAYAKTLEAFGTSTKYVIDENLRAKFTSVNYIVNTLEFDFKAASGNTIYFGSDWVWLYMKAQAGSYSDTRLGNSFALSVSKNGSSSFVNSKTLVGLSASTEYTMRVVVDGFNNTYSVSIAGYVGDEIVEIPTVTDASFGDTTYTVNKLFAVRQSNLESTSNIITFSGEECNAPVLDAVTITTGDKDILVPQGSGNKVQFKYEAKTKKVDEAGIKWSLNVASDGISINENTGVLTVDERIGSALAKSTNDISAATVVVTAKNGTKEDSVNVNLTKISQDFEGYSNGVVPNGTDSGIKVQTETIGEESNNYAKSAQSNGTGVHFLNGSYQTYNYSNNGANIVVEFRAKKWANSACNVYVNGMSTKSSWDNATTIDANGGISFDSQWYIVKIVISPKDKTYKSYVNNRLIKSATTLTDFDDTFKLKSVRFDNDAYYDDLKIYNTNNSAPAATVTPLTSAIPGEDVTLSYSYASFDDLAENGTEIKWSVAFEKEGPYTQISGANTATLAVTDDMDYKYIKATITPKHKDLLNDSVYISGEPVETIVQAKSFDFTVTYTKAASAEDTAVAFDPKDTAPADGERVVATVEGQRYTTDTKTILIAIAKYSASGDLVEFAQDKTIELPSGYTRDNNLLIESAGGKIKLFIWDNATNRPYFVQTIK